MFYLCYQDQMPTSFSSSSNGSTWPRSLLLLPDGQKCLGASWNFLGRLLNTQARGQEANSLSSHCWIVTLAPGPRDPHPLQMDQRCLCLIGFYYFWRTRVAKRVGPMFCESCSCSCLPLLPGLASKITQPGAHSYWQPLRCIKPMLVCTIYPGGTSDFISKFITNPDSDGAPSNCTQLSRYSRSMEVSMPSTEIKTLYKHFVRTPQVVCRSQHLFTRHDSTYVGIE